MSRLARAGTALIQASTAVDRAYRVFVGARSALVAALASDDLLEAINERAYAATPAYRTDSEQFRESLFHWEEEAIARHFPPAPARILVGGAGGGREPFALAARGYDVVAFEPADALLSLMASRAHPGVCCYRGRYEQLPFLRDTKNGDQLDLRALEPFDAAILGWASYSHLRTTAARVASLRQVSVLTRGPLLVSFYLAPPLAPPAGVRRWLARRHLWSAADRFTPAVGFYHLSTRDELLDEVAAAGLQLLEFSEDALDGRWPYCVLKGGD